MLSNECCRLENEKKCVSSFGSVASFIHHSDLEGQITQVSEQGTRKVLYQKVSRERRASAQTQGHYDRSLLPSQLVGLIRVRYREKVRKILFVSSVRPLDGVSFL